MMEDKRIAISIVKKIGTKYATTSDLGNSIYSAIVTGLSEYVIVYLDFDGLELITAPFLDAAIGRIYRESGDIKVLKNLRFKNFPVRKRSILRLIIKNAKSYRKNSKNYMKVANEILGEIR